MLFVSSFYLSVCESSKFLAGVEVKPGKPFTHTADDVRGRLHISQVTNFQLTLFFP